MKGVAKSFHQLFKINCIFPVWAGHANQIKRPGSVNKQMPKRLSFNASTAKLLATVQKIQRIRASINQTCSTLFKALKRIKILFIQVLMRILIILNQTISTTNLILIMIRYFPKLTLSYLNNNTLIILNNGRLMLLNIKHLIPLPKIQQLKSHQSELPVTLIPNRPSALHKFRNNHCGGV